jgi:hypothetical protein
LNTGIARRRTEEKRAAAFLCGRRRRRRILDVRAADLQEEMAEQRFSVLSAPTKTAAIERTSQRAKRAIKYSAMREQLQKMRCLLLGVAGKKLSEHLTERRSGVQLREDCQPTQPDTMDEQIAGWEVELHCDPA